MSDENEYSGSGHFVGGSEVEAPKPAKKTAISDRQIVREPSAPAPTAKDVDNAQVGANAVVTSEALGNPQPPIGGVVGGVVKELAPWVAGGLGLKAAWDILSSQKGQDSNDGSKSAWGKTTAGRPENAQLGAAPVQQPAAPVQQAAAPAPVGVPAPAPQVAMAGEPQPQMQYGQTKINAPTGVPSPVASVAPPVEAAPLSELEQIKLDKAKFELEAAKAKEARAAELHQSKLAADAKRAEATVQKSQGKAFNNQDNTILANAEKVKAEKAIEAAGVKKTPKPAPAASVAPPVAATPVVEAVAPVEAVQPPAKAPKAKLEMPEGWGKGMSWLVNQHGVEGAQDFVNRYNNGKPFATYDDMMKSYQENTTRPKYSDIPKDVRKSRGIAPPTQSGVAGKAAGVAGAALLLPTISEAAQATKEGDTQKARANIMEWLNLHPVGAIANQLFGTSPEELETLRRADRSRKVGAGRGIAPPSAYLR